MAEVINDNPIVLEQWQLPTRQLSEANWADKLGLEDRELQELSLANAEEFLANEANDGSAPDLEEDAIDAQEIYDLISTVSDPEHPLTLGQLAVVSLDRIKIDDNGPDKIGFVTIEITPTITHCSLATLIGLGLRVRLERCLPERFRIRILVTPGSHQSEAQVNKQLNDKERVAAACENEQLLNVIGQMLSTCTPAPLQLDTPEPEAQSDNAKMLPQLPTFIK